MSWESSTSAVEVAVFEHLWRWLTARRADVDELGGSFAVYCYNASAEATHLRRLVRLAGLGEGIDEFLRSDDRLA